MAGPMYGTPETKGGKSMDNQGKQLSLDDLYPGILDYHDGSDLLEIKVLYHNGVMPLEHVNGKSDWIDLRAAKSMTFKKGEFGIIPLGVSMKLPDGYEAHIVPRSSTFMKYKLIQANSMGIIDNSYCGDKDEWGFPAYAVENTFVAKGNRICQFRIVKKMPEVRFVEVDHLSDESRGGFGSTGTN